MLVMIYLLSLCVGLIVGSFLNVVILRWNTGRTLGGRSGCLSCNVQLAARDLLPVLGYLFLGGRCRNCGSAISIQYPLVELFTALVFVGLVNKAIFTPLHLIELIILLVIFSILIVLVVYDIRHKIIPNEFVYTFIVLSLILRIAHTPVFSWDLLAGPVFFLAFAFLWLISRGEWMGFGDAKLVLGIGLLLGLTLGLASLAIAFWVGAIVGLILLSVGRKSISLKSEIPFAPFLVLGATVAFFWSDMILSFLANYFYFFSQ